MAALGLVGLAVLHFLRRRTSLELHTWPRSAAVSAEGNGCANEGATLRALGGELRQLVLRQKLDSGTIAAAEWAMDRHNSAAVRVLSAGFGLDEILCRKLEGWAQELLAAAAIFDPTSPINRCYQNIDAALKILMTEVGISYA